MVGVGRVKMAASSHRLIFRGCETFMGADFFISMNTNYLTRKGVSNWERGVEIPG